MQNHPEVDEEQEGIINVDDFKCGINLPLWWGKGIVCDPRQMSIHEVERLSRGYVRLHLKFVDLIKIFQHSDVL
ncbi:hypothetical protein NFD60_12145 [Staphylococcus epidermidis]|nr:hypothetical protein NFD60_12145 [Staphylococcus epidermidis]